MKTQYTNIVSQNVRSQYSSVELFFYIPNIDPNNCHDLNVFFFCENERFNAKIIIPSNCDSYRTVCPKNGNT